MPPALPLRAGPDALALLRERGLRPADVDVVPGASGGAKWLALAGLDRYLFGEFLRVRRGPRPAVRPHRRRRDPRPPVGPPARHHGRGARGGGERAARGARGRVRRRRGRHLLSRRTLGWQLTRCVFHSAGGDTPFAHLADLPTVHRPLAREILRAALQASGSIPLLMEGVRVPGAPGLHWDGGTLDYHLALDFGPGDGLVLYPHFHPHVVPGWFDKGLAWRRAGGPRHRARFRRVLLVAPSDAFVAALPGGKIPDRRDFYALPNAERVRRWRAVVDASARLGDELRELVAAGRVAEAVRAL